MKKRKSNVDERQVPSAVTVRIRDFESIKENLEKQKQRCKKDVKSFCIDKAVELLYGYFINEDEDAFRNIDSDIALEILRFLREIVNN